MNKRTTAVLLTTTMIAWLAIALYVVFSHEMWLDEAHHWLLARDSNSVGELLSNMRYEGHPPLWNLLLFLLTRFTHAPVAMQLLNVLFAFGCVVILLWYTPFPLWLRILLPFTYFFGYEYVALARNYSSAVFFLLLACVLLRNIRKNHLLIGIALGTVVLFHIYAGVIAGFLLLFCAVQLMQQKEYRATVIMSVIFGVCTLLTVWQAITPSDHFLYARFNNNTFSINHIGTVLSMPYSALLHFPEISDNWWNRNLLAPNNLVFRGIVVFIFWVLTAAVFIGNKRVFFLYLASAIALSGLYLFTPMPLALRHAGFFLVLFLVCCWLLYLENGQFNNWQKKLIAGLVVLQCISFATVAVVEVRMVFSSAQQTAEWINTNYPGIPVVVYPQCNGPAVSLYLGKPVFYTEQRATGSFADWRNERFTITPSEMKQECLDYMKTNQLDSVLLVTAYTEQYLDGVTQEMKLLATFDEGVVKAEHYSIYLFKR